MEKLFTTNDEFSLVGKIFVGKIIIKIGFSKIRCENEKFKVFCKNALSWFILLTLKSLKKLQNAMFESDYELKITDSMLNNSILSQSQLVIAVE